jgi:hypothetical protein
MKIVRPEPPPVAWQNQDLILYHGTRFHYAEEIIRAGIKLSVCSPLTDFGRGFYTTTLLPQAMKWSAQLSERNNETVGGILEYRVKREDLAQLDILWFTFTTTSEEFSNFWSFVFHCRDGNEWHKQNGTMLYYDVVVGPVADKWKDKFLIEDADQVSFHTDKAASILKNAELIKLEL